MLYTRHSVVGGEARTEDKILCTQSRNPRYNIRPTMKHSQKNNNLDFFESISFRSQSNHSAVGGRSPDGDISSTVDHCRSPTSGATRE